MTAEDSVELLKDPNTPLIELIIAKIVDKALNQGDDKRLEFILNRLLGKVKDEVDINNFRSHIEQMPESQIIDLGKDAIKFLGKKDT